MAMGTMANVVRMLIVATYDCTLDYEHKHVQAIYHLTLLSAEDEASLCQIHKSLAIMASIE